MRDNLELERAFPRDGHDFAGMSLRDYFAAKAMQGELAAMSDFSSQGVAGLSIEISNESLTLLAKHWFRIADAMIGARK